MKTCTITGCTKRFAARGVCGEDVCPKYKRITLAAERRLSAGGRMHTICADDQLIDAIQRRDRAAAYARADRVLVDMLTAWVDDCGRPA